MPNRKRRKSGSHPEKKLDGAYICVYHKSFPNGKKRLGRYDTDEAKKEADKAYCRFITEWAAMVDVVGSHKNQSYLIDDLAVAFLRWAERVYGNSDFCNNKTAIKTMLEIFSGTLIKDFGPKALKTAQDRFVEKGYVRKYCNKLTCILKTVRNWSFRIFDNELSFFFGFCQLFKEE